MSDSICSSSWEIVERGEVSSTKLALDIDGRNNRGKDINCKIIRKRSNREMRERVTIENFTGLVITKRRMRWIDVETSKYFESSRDGDT
jgi:hypothetical protein